MFKLLRAITARLKGMDQRAGIAILTSLGFMLFSVPLITGSLDLAQNTSIDSRVKTDITHRQYCGLGTQEYLYYLLSDNSRWLNWVSANVDPNDPSNATSTEIIDPCGRDITITVAQQSILPTNSIDPDAGGFGGDIDGDYSDELVGFIPPLSAYGNRSLQTTKTVSNSNPEPGESVLYTIKIVNLDDSNTGLTKIKESLPPGFSYDCNGPDNILSLPGVESQVIVPFHDECPDEGETDFDWHMPSETTLPSGGVATLTFTAITSVQNGTYCNSVHVDPGGTKTTSGKTAIVQISDQAGLCSGDAVSVSKTVDTAVLVSTNTLSGDYVYTFDIDFNITLENIGSTAFSIKEYIDLLPTGFSYVPTSPNGDITEIPHNLHHESQVDRKRVTWKFDEAIVLSPGESQSLIF